MANRIVKRPSRQLAHCGNYSVSSVSPYDPAMPIEPEIDKSMSISELNRDELRQLIGRLRQEREAQDLIRDLRRSSGEKDSYDNPFPIDTSTPINQLYHYGILGQKWGVRRFQNKDGTRTAAGKKRDEDSGYEKSEDHKISRENKGKAPSGLSNDELKRLNERLQLEETYSRLTAEKIQKSESFVKKALRDAGSQALTDFSKGVFLGSAKVLVKNLSPQFYGIAFTKK